MNSSVMSRGEIFSINFIRRDFIPLSIRRIAISLVGGYLGINLLVMIGLLGAALWSYSSQAFLQAKFQDRIQDSIWLSKVKQDMEIMQEQATHDTHQMNAIMTLKKQRFPFTGKLAALAETLPARTWIRLLSADQEEKSLKIEAVYLVDPEQPYTLPVKEWVEALKNQPRFAQGLKRLDLVTSSRQTQGKSDLFSFELLAEWEIGAKR